MMKKHRKNSNWPYLAILLCLFALSVAAPRHWRNLNRATDSSRGVANGHALDQTPAPGTSAKASTTIAKVAPPTELAMRSSTTAPHFESKPTPAPRQSNPQLQKFDDATTYPPREVEPSALVKSPRSEPAAGSPDGPRLVLAAEKITELQTIEPLPRLNHAPVTQPLLVQPPVVQPLATQSPVEVNADGDVASQIAALSSWPPCSALIEQLERIDVDVNCKVWAQEVIDLLDQLASLEADNRQATDETLKSLRLLAASVDEVIKSLGSEEDVDDQYGATQLRHARYALLRRLDLWEQTRAVELATDEPSPPTATQVGLAVAKSVDEVAHAASQMAIGSSWNRYLLLDELRSLAKDVHESDVARRQQGARQRQVAHRVLARLESPGLDAAQRRFAESGPVKSFKSHLRHWATETVDSSRLLADVEQFEQAGRSDDARRVAQTYQQIRFSPSPAERDLAKQIDMHYRNANIRLAVTDRFLNLMLPRIAPTLGTINDNILGNPIRGRQVTTTKLRTRLIPNHRRLRFLLEAHGEVHSRTTAMNSQATLHSRGISRYRAGKLLQIGPRGMRMWPARAEVRSDVELEDVETSYDNMPLISSIAQSYARDQHEQMRDAAMYEVDRKVRRRATQSLDAAVDGQINKYKATFSTHILEPLTHLSLKPQPVQLLTTSDRMVSRIRVATADQLAAYTPRPRAPEDSLLSLQVHESVAGNIIERLDLDGRAFTLRALHEWISKKTGRADWPIPLETMPQDVEEELPEDATITFAEHDALRVRFEAGRVEVVLHLKQLETANRRMKNFTVKAIYEPHSEGLVAMLVRRDGISLSSTRRINMRGQIMLRGIFAKVFSKNRPIHLLGQQITSKPSLKNLCVTQFVVHEGWLGIAIGPRRAKNVKPRPVVARNTK